eukprot:TRINITY_DN33885_c0_g1_i1.p2 TRINITY_DN33885_c0_g1~~TRINITY_DN33885_c0_g1_i1.p2  ORF type:complete len:240 (-),score=33.82 TRINITY_DN33885_c0_g1_i1:31-750(-)
MAWSGVSTGELTDVVLNSLVATLKAAIAADTAGGAAREPSAATDQASLGDALEALKSAATLEENSRRPQSLTNTKATVCKLHLDEASRLMRARGHRLAAPLAPLLRRLHWSQGEGGVQVPTADAEILVVPGLHVGVSLTAPYTQRLLHSRDADEFVIPLSDAFWLQEDPDAEPSDPTRRFGRGRLLNGESYGIGSVVQRPAGKITGSRTAGDPLLAVWLRYGEIDSGARYLAPTSPRRW